MGAFLLSNSEEKGRNMFPSVQLFVDTALLHSIGNMLSSGHAFDLLSAR
jgi:hypothetical protein